MSAPDDEEGEAPDGRGERGSRSGDGPVDGSADASRAGDVSAEPSEGAAGAGDEPSDASNAVRRPDALDRVLDPIDRRLPARGRVVQAVVAIALVALVARLWALDFRVMHWDEARVAYWVLRAVETGDWRYRFIIHGPFVQHVDRVLFALFGTPEFVARLPVAVVGALLPLSALLFRRHLRDGEVVALALLFAADPILLYYSRFLRSDVLVAAFMVVALGLLVRLYDTRDVRYLYLASVFVAFGFASKENAVVYLLCWGGMLATVAGLEVLVPRRHPDRAAVLDDWQERVGSWARTTGRAGVARWVGHVLGALVVFGLVTVFFYAPRSAGAAGTGLWSAAPTATIDATVGALESGFEHWVGGDGPPSCLGTGSDASFLERWACNIGREATVLASGSAVLVALSVIGFVAEQRRRVPRVLVPAAFYWGVASLLGYPLGTDIMFPGWIAVHPLVALAIPAAAGLALLVRWGLEAREDGEVVDAAIAGVLVAVVVVGLVATGAGLVYVSPQAGNPDAASVVQFAQPASYMQDELGAMERVAATNDGVDVVVYGDTFVDGATTAPRMPACVRWFALLPMSWYLYQGDVEVACADTRENLTRLVAEEDPPIVIAAALDSTVTEEELAGDYESRTYLLRLWSQENRDAVWYVNRSAMDVAGDRAAFETAPGVRSPRAAPD